MTRGRLSVHDDLPPSAIETEAAILSACMLDPAVIVGVAEIVGPEDFYSSAHQKIFSTICDLYHRSEPVDLVTLSNRLKEAGGLKAIGGAVYLARIVDAAPLAVNAPHYARIVRRAAVARKGIETLNRATRDLMEGGDPAKVVPATIADLTKVTSGATGPVAGFRFVAAAELEPRPAQWLFRDVAEAGTICLLYGESETLKSFVAIDMCGCCATGTTWHGHAVERTGPAAYICGEGLSGIGRRIHAWCIRHHRDKDDLPVYVSTMPAELIDAGKLAEVRSAVDAIAREHGTPVLIVIDTLARNFGAGDENSTQDMSAFVSALDSLRVAYGATIVVIHHVGHAAKDRARGAAALRAAVDAEYRFERDPLSGLVRMTGTKMKDAPTPDPMAFAPRVVELGITDDGEPVKSLILDDADWTPPTKTGREGRGKWQRLAVDTLHNLYEKQRANLEAAGYNPEDARVAVDDWRAACQAQGMNRQAWSRFKSTMPEGITIRHGFAEWTEGVTF